MTKLVSPILAAALVVSPAFAWPTVKGLAANQPYPLVQIWVVMATLETYLAGHHETALAGAIISGMILLTCFGLYLFIDRLDAEVRER